MDTAIADNQILIDLPTTLPQWSQIRVGSLAVHIANSQEEIEAAQVLRYRIYYGEMGGTPTDEMRAAKRDFDIFDSYCDHLLVLDYARPGAAQVVGTYRLLRRSALRALKQFYSEGEFDIRAIKQEKGEILELGRSCVDANYRNRAVMQLLWRGIAAYVSLHDIKLMFGCASLLGTDVKNNAMALSYLHHFHPAPAFLRMTALPDQYVEMNCMPREVIDVKEVYTVLPALIKGYLRLNACIGHGAVIDRSCNTIDVGIAVKTEMITEKYVQRYSPPTRIGE